MQAKVGNLQFNSQNFETDYTTGWYFESAPAPGTVAICSLPGIDDILTDVFRHLPSHMCGVVSRVCKQFNRNALYCVTEVGPGCYVPAGKLLSIAPSITKVFMDTRVKEILQRVPTAFPNVTQLRVANDVHDILDNHLLSLFPNVEKLNMGITELVTDQGLKNLHKVELIATLSKGRVTSEGMYHMSKLTHILLYVPVDHSYASNRGIELSKLVDQFPNIVVRVSTRH